MFNSTERLEKPNAISMMRSKLPFLPDSEKKVAEWILKNPENLLHASMAQVAQACQVSDTTVLRLCRDLGYQGYTELKIKLAQDVANPMQMIHDSISPDDDPITIARKVFSTNIQALYDSMEMLTPEDLINAIEHIESANRILIAGVGGSAPVALAAFHRFMRMGLPVTMPLDVYTQIMQASLLDSRGLVIGISYSGMTVDPIMVLAEAKKHGAFAISITGNAQSKIAEYADITLVAVSHETRSDAIASRVAMTSIIDAISVNISLRHLDETLESEKKVVDSIIPKTY